MKIGTKTKGNKKASRTIRLRQIYFKNRPLLLGLVILLLLVGGLVFYRSIAASCDAAEKDENRCYSTNTYSNFWFANNGSGYDSLNWDITVNNEPNNGQAVYFSTTFGFTPTPNAAGHGGYAGIQKAADGKKLAIFSIWNAEAAYSLDGRICLNAKDKFSYGNSECEIVDYEPPNTASSVRLKYDWRTGVKYNMRVEKYVIPQELAAYVGRPAGTYFTGSIYDPTKQHRISLGSIRVKPGVNGITGNNNGTRPVTNFTEFVGANPPGISSCDQVNFISATFGQPRFNDNVGLFRQPEQADIAYQPNRNCAGNANVKILGDGSFLHERGPGVNRVVSEPPKALPSSFASIIPTNFGATRYAGSNELNISPLIHFTGYRQNPNQQQQPIPTTPANPPPTPPLPTCTSGALRPEYLLPRPGNNPTNPTECDDGQWVLYFDVWVPFGPNNSNKKQFTYYRNTQTGQCGTKSGAPVGTLPHAGPYYMYAQNCGDLDTIKLWLVAAFRNEIGPKINALQDFQSQNAGPRTTPATQATFNQRNANKGMKTWPSWEKPNQGARQQDFPGYIPLPNFIPDYHGLLSVNSPTNFWGSIWGYMDGKWVAASNMAQYGKNAGPNTAMIFGPFENPGGNAWQATANGKKVMKVCWNIKDLLAAGSGNTQHSVVKLQATSNGGNPLYNDAYMIYQLKGTEFTRYCRDNIKIPGSWVQNLEYPVTYLSGSIAVAEIERTIYWPEGSYTVNIPSNTNTESNKFGTKDPFISQTSRSGIHPYRGECEAFSFVNDMARGCKLTQKTPIRIRSSVFGANKANGTKQVCVVARVPGEGKRVMAYFYGANQGFAGSYSVLKLKTYLWDLSGRAMYCANSDLKTFDSVVISTDVTDTTNPVLLETLTVN